MERTEHTFELIEPEDALDLVPTWELEFWWFLVGFGAILVLLSVVLLVKRRSTPADLGALKRAAYQEAVKDFEGTQEIEPRRSAVESSLILRKYLAKSLGEPALFETHEELISRDNSMAVLPDELRAEVGGYFAKLAKYKYSPEQYGPGSSREILDEGRKFLERIHCA